jgi:hypothetical protein
MDCGSGITRAEEPGAAPASARHVTSAALHISAYTRARRRCARLQVRRATLTIRPPRPQEP